MRIEIQRIAPRQSAPGHRTYSGDRALTAPLPRINYDHVQLVLDVRDKLGTGEDFYVA